MATAEYVAVLVLISSLVLIAAPADLARPITGSIQAAFCKLSGSECPGPSSSALPPEHFVPSSCTLSDRSYKGEIGVSVAFFDTKQGVSFARSERSDGKTAFTVVDEGGVGVSAEVGAEAEFGAGKLDVGAEARAGLDAKMGDTWVVDAGEADRLQTRLLGGEGIKRTLGSKVPLVGDQLSDWAADRIWGEMGEPDITFAAAGVNVSAEATTNAELFGQQVAGASVKPGAAVLLGIESDRTDDDPARWTTTRYLQADLSSEGGLSYVAGSFGGKVESTSIIKAKYDAQNVLIEMELSTSVGKSELVSVGSALSDTTSLLNGTQKGTVVETSTITFDGDAERRAGERYIESFGSDADALTNLMRAKSVSTVVTNTSDQFGGSVGGKVALALKLGARAEISTTDEKLVDAYYLGAPDASGRRDFVPFTACTSAGG